MIYIYLKVRVLGFFYWWGAGRRGYFSLPFVIMNSILLFVTLESYDSYGCYSMAFFIKYNSLYA